MKCKPLWHLPLLFSATFLAEPLLAQRSYPMTCRGGGATLGFDSSRATALLYFAKASGPAGVGLAPGQCSWIDRAIGPNEPTCLAQAGVVTAAWIFPGNLSGSYFNSTNAPWLRGLLRSDVYQTFQVYNPGNGNCFVVSRLGP